MFSEKSATNYMEKLTELNQEEQSQSGLISILNAIIVIMIVVPLGVIAYLSSMTDSAWLSTGLSALLLCVIGFVFFILFNSIVDHSVKIRELCKNSIELLREKDAQLDNSNVRANAAGKFAEHLCETYGLSNIKYVPTVESMKSTLDAAMSVIEKSKISGDEGGRKIDELTDIQKRYEVKISLLSKELEDEKKKSDYLSGQCDEIFDKMTAMERETLNDISLPAILRNFNARIQDEDLSYGSSYSLNRQVDVLYSLLHKIHPDPELLKKNANVPHELLRAQQIETVIERYSSLITEVEKSDVSDVEKRDKINAYRLARERELGIEE